jgi:hypothetical protein
MAQAPELIGLCPNRLVEGSHHANVQLLRPTDAMICEACGGPLTIYEQTEFDKQGGVAAWERHGDYDG